MITINPCRTNKLTCSLISLWEKSVRATHLFLTEDDIQNLIPFVKEGISQIETLIVDYEDNKPIAFMGIDSDKIEMLFVLPGYSGKGVGREMMEQAVKQYHVKYVDVNEQNPQATGFYRHMGFEVSGRTDFDEQGNPFPILKMKLKGYSIRRATTEDIPVLINIFQNTILSVNRRDYTQAEVEDWASCRDNPPKWKQTIEIHYFIVAENPLSQIAGFSSITPEGHLHFMFVHKDHQNRGIATMLLKNIEQYAKNNDIRKISSDVSLTARPFFERQGYMVISEQKQKANRLCLTNFKMEKQI